MAKQVADFIRQNIVTVLAIPPLVALAFGVYAKVVRKTISEDLVSPGAQEIIRKTDSEELKD